jgi:hypothetical protein
MMGRDSALALTRTVTDSSSLRLGPPVVPPPAFFDLTAMKAEIAEGRVPDQFRNGVTAVMGRNGTLWLLVQTELEIRKYTSNGQLVWTRRLEVPETEESLREFFRKNAGGEGPVSDIPPLHDGRSP